MTALAATAAPAAPPEAHWPDARLVRACAEGSQRAWAALIERYQNLIYSIPYKQGFAPDDAAEIFQSVCLSLLTEIPRLRDPQALPAWLIRTTTHRCYRFRKQQARWLGEEAAPENEASAEPEVEERLRQGQQEQMLRQAIAALPPRCRELLSMLFTETPPRSYDEIARQLGLARGSVSLTRSRCLERLRRELERAGFTGR